MTTTRTSDSSYRDLPTLVVSAGLAGWLWATIASNNPASQEYDRLRRLMPHVGVILPNWRFFAPQPAQHDNHLVYRLRTDAGRQTDWRILTMLPTRRWWRLFVNPGRRRCKALSDAIRDISTKLATYPIERIPQERTYRLVQAFLANEIRSRYPGDERPEGFQFAIVRYAGYDNTEDPEYLILSPYVAL
jgi:hypothetical protein